MEGLKQLRYLSRQNNLIVKTDTKVCKVSMRVLVSMFVLVWAAPRIVTRPLGIPMSILRGTSIQLVINLGDILIVGIFETDSGFPVE